MEALQTSFHPQLAKVAARKREEEKSQRHAVQSAIERLGAEIAYERREREEMVEEIRRRGEERGDETRREIAAYLKQSRSEEKQELASLRASVEELQDQIMAGGKGRKRGKGGTLLDVVRSLENRVGAMEERVEKGEVRREEVVRVLENKVKHSLETMAAELHAIRSQISASFDTIETRIHALESSLATHTASTVSPSEISDLRSALDREQSARLALEHNMQHALHLAITSLHQDILQSL